MGRAHDTITNQFHDIKNPHLELNNWPLNTCLKVSLFLVKRENVDLFHDVMLSNDIL